MRPNLFDPLVTILTGFHCTLFSKELPFFFTSLILAGRSPLGQMPFLVTPEGKILGQSGAIMKYICKKGGKQNYIPYGN